MSAPTLRRAGRSSMAAAALALSGLLLLAGRSAHAQSPADRLSGRIDPEAGAAVSALIDSAAARGVPPDPLVAKALEGASKGAAGERIVVAVRRLAVDLASARLALGDVSEVEVVAGAGALRAGASSELLAQLKQMRGNESVLLPLATLADLVARGTPVDRAASVVLGLAKRGAAEDDYRAAQSGATRGDGAREHGPPTGAPGAAGRDNGRSRGVTPGASRPVTPPGSPPASPPGTGRPAGRP
jgi:hypothetical protein